jgi:hypothetical protein
METLVILGGLTFGMIMLQEAFVFKKLRRTGLEIEATAMAHGPLVNNATFVVDGKQYAKQYYKQTIEGTEHKFI